VFSLVILDEAYVNKRVGGWAAGSPANCKLQTACGYFLQPLIFLFLFLSRKKEKTLISSGLAKAQS
jgi:hypothetical protein